MLFDVHAHLTHEAFTDQMPELIARAEQAGLGTIICNGLNPRDNQAVLDLAARYPMIKPALGLYPVDAVLMQMRAAGEDYPDQREAWPASEAVAWVETHIDQA